jgi:ATP-binding cassette subfamily F protein 3
VPIAALSSIRHGYGTKIVLDGATVGIEAGEKVGLVGRNGGGKSTLMKVMAGIIAPDSGSVQIQRGARIGYLSQDPRLDPGDTLRHAAARAFAELDRLHRELEATYEKMAAPDADIDQLLKRQARLEEEMERAGGYAIDHRIDETLHGLGFTDAQFNLPVTALSGGQRARVGLARLLLEQPDLLLLDEPTNHLDIEGRKWLEHFLADEYPGAVLLVSHDRRLLDYVVHRIVEVEQGRVLEYPGNYADFIELRRERLLNHQRVFDKQQDKIRSEQQYIMRYKAGQRAKQARGRQTRLERYQRDEVGERPIELETMNLELPKAPRVGDHVLRAAGLSKRYDQKVLFSNLDISVTPGDRIGIIGPNGAGKTTLVRALLGDLNPDAGELKVSPQLSVGYFRQTQDHIDRTITVWEYLQRVIISNEGGARASEQQARNLAGAFLFSGNEQEKLVGDLSGGERARMVIAGLVAAAHNLIVLDEPTNHLDIPSAERMEAALATAEEGGAYEGSLILISHDRALLDACCTKLVIMDGQGGARVFEGSWSEWEARHAEELAAREAEAKADAERQRQREAKASSSKAPAPKAAAGPAAPAAPKKSTAPRPPGAKRAPEDMSTDDLEARITQIEERTRALDAELMDPAVYTDAKRSQKLTQERTRLQQELEPLEFEWSRRS